MFTSIYLFAGEPVHGNFSEWTIWSKCSVDCGVGARERFRYCDNPSPRNGGRKCLGLFYENETCHQPVCSGRTVAPEGENCDQYCQRLGKTPQGNFFVEFTFRS